MSTMRNSLLCAILALAPVISAPARQPNFIWIMADDLGYGDVRCPQILVVELWKRSGHWDNYKDNMFFTESE